jgi:hypothetical protein
MLEEVDHTLQKDAARLSKLEQNIIELQHYTIKKSGGGLSPVSKAMNFSMSMVAYFEPRQAKSLTHSKTLSPDLSKDCLLPRLN